MLTAAATVLKAADAGAAAPPIRGRNVKEAPRLRIPLGTRIDTGEPVVWDSKVAINGHFIAVGPTGSGKTHQLNRIMAAMVEQGIRRIHVLNVHGDLCQGIPEHLVHTVHFSDYSPYGLQPLELLNDSDIGGVRRRAQAFIRLLMRQGALGARQKPALYRLLLDGYRKFGFYHDRPETWTLDFDPRPGASPDRPKRYPTLTDLKNSVWLRLVAMKTGQTQTAAAAMEKVFKLARKRHALGKKLHLADAEDQQKVMQQIEKAQDDAVKAFEEAVYAVQDGDELSEAVLWDNADAIQSLYDRIESLEASGIFKGTPPAFSRLAPVRDYNIKALEDTEQQLFVDCLLEKIYVAAKQRGESDGPLEFVILDEASLFVMEDPQHILNKMVKQLRKFGVGVVLAAQDFKHFSDDLLNSAAVKLVLGCPDMYLEETRKRLALPMMDMKGIGKVNPISMIRPKHTAFAGVVTAGANSPMSQVLLHPGSR